MVPITGLPPAPNGHQLMLAFPAHYKLQPLPGLLILVGVLCMQHLGVDPAHQNNLRQYIHGCWNLLLTCGLPGDDAVFWTSVAELQWNALQGKSASGTPCVVAW